MDKNKGQTPLVIPDRGIPVNPASSLAVARASAAVLAGAMIYLAHQAEDEGIEIGERLGTLILVVQAIYGELERLAPELQGVA